MFPSLLRGYYGHLPFCSPTAEFIWPASLSSKTSPVDSKKLPSPPFVETCLPPRFPRLFLSQPPQGTLEPQRYSPVFLLCKINSPETFYPSSPLLLQSGLCLCPSPPPQTPPLYLKSYTCEGLPWAWKVLFEALKHKGSEVSGSTPGIIKTFKRRGRSRENLVF